MVDGGRGAAGRDHARLLFEDDQYPVWPLTPEQSAYASINGARMKGHVVAMSQISLRDRDRGHKWWGRLPGTEADKETMAYLTREFESLGLTVEHFPYVIPEDWRPTDWSVSYKTADGATIELTTAFPVADTKATGAQGITADAIWVGVGSGADFLGPVGHDEHTPHFGGSQHQEAGAVDRDVEVKDCEGPDYRTISFAEFHIDPVHFILT